MDFTSDYLKYSMLAVHVLAFACLFASVLMMVFHGFMVLKNLRSDRTGQASFAGPLVILLPDFLSATGLQHRAKFFRFVLVAILSAAVLFGLDAALAS